MTTTTTAVEHGICIVQVHLPAGTPLRAECLCGWQSEIVASRPAATEAGAAHIAELSTGVESSSTPARAPHCMTEAGR